MGVAVQLGSAASKGRLRSTGDGCKGGGLWWVTGGSYVEAGGKVEGRLCRSWVMYGLMAAV